ncbi:hypothetical protein ACFQ1I_22315 [Kitasatospora arboriphila]
MVWAVVCVDGVLDFLSRHYGWSLNVQAAVAFPINFVACMVVAARRGRR